MPTLGKITALQQASFSTLLICLAFFATGVMLAHFFAQNFLEKNHTIESFRSSDYVVMKLIFL